jgi:hypothetical protein
MEAGDGEDGIFYILRFWGFSHRTLYVVQGLMSEVWRTIIYL